MPLAILIRFAIEYVDATATVNIGGGARREQDALGDCEKKMQHMSGRQKTKNSWEAGKPR